MKNALLILFVIASSRLLFAGESTLTTTYQPLDGLGAEKIVIAAVTCHDWDGHGGGASAIELISARNVPPTNHAKEATANLNLASVCGVRFQASDLGDPEAPLKLTLDVSKLVIPKDFGYSQEDVIRASLECLRRTLPEKLRKTPVELKAAKANQTWVSAIVGKFNAHDRRKVFYAAPE